MFVNVLSLCDDLAHLFTGILGKLCSSYNNGRLLFPSRQHQHAQ